MTVFRLLWQAIQLWWQHWISLLFLTILWLLLTVPLITIPPATAVFFTLASYHLKGETWDMNEAWQLMQDLFWPSWKWALPNLLILITLTGNFIAYQTFEGSIWQWLRWGWGMVTAVWFLLNLFFWPFWLIQEDKSLSTTYNNTFRFFVSHPLISLIIGFLSTILLTISIQLVFPILLGTVSFLIITSLHTVQYALQRAKT